MIIYVFSLRCIGKGMMTLFKMRSSVPCTNRQYMNTGRQCKAVHMEQGAFFFFFFTVVRLINRG